MRYSCLPAIACAQLTQPLLPPSLPDCSLPLQPAADSMATNTNPFDQLNAPLLQEVLQRVPSKSVPW